MEPTKSDQRRLKQLADEIPDENAVRDVLRSLESADSALADYSIALIGASVLERALEVAILSRFRRLREKERKQLFSYENRGPLADFSSRIKMAYALDIYGRNTRADLEKVRRVRNAFAHSNQLISFETPAVAGICNSLHTPTTTTALGREGGDSPRGRYINTTLTLSRRVKSGLTRGEVPFLGVVRAEHVLS